MSERLSVKGFKWCFETLDADGKLVHKESANNLIPSEGMAFLVRSPFGDVSPAGSFHLGLFRGNYIPSAATTAADIPTAMIEFIDYTEAQRPVWQRQFDGISSMDNALNKASFTVTQDREIYGAFLVTEATKGSNTGLVLSCVRFSSPKTVTAGQTINLFGGLTYVSANVI